MYNILVCPSSFPNKYFPLEAVFVKRHLDLIAVGNKVIVAYAKDGDDIKGYDLVISTEDDIIIITCYFEKCSKGKLKNYINLYRFLIAHFFAVKKALEIIKKVDFCHVHVLTRAAIIPFFLKLFKGIPFFISEHSTSFLRDDTGLVAKFKNHIQSFIVSSSRGVSAVSHSLKSAMLKKGLVSNNFLVIPNLIDNEFFYPISVNQKNEKIKFLHVSRLHQQSKNVEGLLNAFSRLVHYSNLIELHIVGGYNDDISRLKNHIESLNLQITIIFYGNISREELRSMYQQSDFLVAFSNYETQAIVNLEALMCGVPIIATKIPAIQEYLHEKNSLLVNPGDELAFAKCLEQCIVGNYKFWNKEFIALEIKRRYNKESIIKSFEKFYVNGF